MSKNLTIIILIYNSAKIIENCLRAFDVNKYRVIVVDNASTDGGAEIVAKKFAQVEIIKLPHNIGYGSGNNVALRLVQTEFALILNPDAIISDENIAKVLQEMQNHKSAAMAGPMVLEHYPAKQNEVDEFLEKVNKDLNSIKDNFYEKIGNVYSVRFVIGAALFMRMNLMQKIGFFDQNFFLYYEDDELCGRVVKNGYQNIIVPEARAFHEGGASSLPSTKIIYLKAWHLIWSKLYFKSLKKGVFSAKRSSCRFIFTSIFRAIFSLTRLNYKAFIGHVATLNGAFSFLIGLKAFKKDGTARARA